MKRYALHLLTGAIVGLSLLLIGLWFKPDGTVRNGTWVPPQPLLTDYQAMLPVLPPIGSADTSRFVAMLDRPVFAVTRRPPPPPPPPESVQAPPPDNLSTARLSGVFQGQSAGGVIMLIAGKQRRAQINDAVDGWTLKSIQGQTVTFVRGGQQRVLTLERALLQTAAGEGAAVGGGAAAPGAISRPARPAQGVPGAAFSVPFPVTQPSPQAPPPANTPRAGTEASAAPAVAQPQPTFGGR